MKVTVAIHDSDPSVCGAGMDGVVNSSKCSLRQTPETGLNKLLWGRQWYRTHGQIITEMINQTQN